MIIVIKPFNELTADEMYRMLQIRQDVFVIEQNCIYRDTDDKDYKCHHVLLFLENELAGYCRLVPPGISYPEPSIGRVCTLRKFRMEGVGIELMKTAMTAMQNLWPDRQIVISAQAYLEKFYQKFGFVTKSEPYLEDDIPHIKMICKKQ